LCHRVPPNSHAVNRKHQSVLCFQNFTSFRGTRADVRFLTTIQEVLPFRRLLNETHQHEKHSVLTCRRLATDFIQHGRQFN